jgi:hypothetical protein
LKNKINVSNDNNLTDFDRIKESLNETTDLLSFSLDSKHNIRPDILLETNIKEGGVLQPYIDRRAKDGTRLLVKILNPKYKDTGEESN